MVTADGDEAFPLLGPAATLFVEAGLPGARDADEEDELHDDIRLPPEQKNRQPVTWLPVERNRVGCR